MVVLRGSCEVTWRERRRGLQWNFTLFKRYTLSVWPTCGLDHYDWWEGGEAEKREGSRHFGAAAAWTSMDTHGLDPVAGVGMSWHFRRRRRLDPYVVVFFGTSPFRLSRSHGMLRRLASQTWVLRTRSARPCVDRSLPASKTLEGASRKLHHSTFPRGTPNNLSTTGQGCHPRPQEHTSSISSTASVCSGRLLDACLKGSLSTWLAPLESTASCGCAGPIKLMRLAFNIPKSPKTNCIPTPSATAFTNELCLPSTLNRSFGS